MVAPAFTIQRTPKVVQTFQEDLGNGISLSMVLIPPGKFWMGAPTNELDSTDSERPQHQVEIAAPFFMGQYPVTQAQWQAVMGDNPARFKGADLPVESVSWSDTQEFCQRLESRTNRQYRLPSEAQWEYACRAGTTTPFHFGETIDVEVANYRSEDWKIGDNNVYSGKYGQGKYGKYRQQTTPVGSLKAANAFGLYDMHGNVWEWCEDDWHGDYEGAPADGSAWLNSSTEIDSLKILRGGSWHHGPRHCRSACRVRFDVDSRYDFLGFRVVYGPARTA